MATNHRNEFCVQCQELTLKGDGSRLQHNGSWRTFCASCAVARQTNKNKAVSKAAYIKKQPTLFTEEVNTMNTNPVNNKTNPKEGSTVKCDKNPLNNLVEMPEKPTMEELIAWLTSSSQTHWAKPGDRRILASISGYAKKNGRITPGQKAVIFPFYSQTAAHNNSLTGKTWGHEWQNHICKWCQVSEKELTEKAEKFYEQWLIDNRPKQFIYPVEFESRGKNKHGQTLVTCDRCNGCGEHSFNLRYGKVCFKCSGSGLMLDPLMTEAQIKFIRQLFKSVKDSMTIDEQEELIEIMKSAINGTKRVNKHWAGQTIDKLKNLQTERSAS
jgi:hypothetical protein